MWPFDLFRNKKSRSKRKSDQTRSGYHQIHARLKKLEAQKQTIHLLLHEHHNTLAEHAQLLKNHAQTLDDLVDSPAFNRPTAPAQEHNEAVEMIPRIPPQSRPTAAKPDKLQLSRLSQQERRILTVFFQHPDMVLSYADVGTFLQKSPNTIKNQIRQLAMKADLFAKSTDTQNRNRFQLKDTLRIEKYLNLGEPTAD